MSTYVDGNWSYHSRATTTVIENARELRVTWHGPNNERFRAVVRQKPNAIGFRAWLPGDAKGPTK